MGRPSRGSNGWDLLFSLVNILGSSSDTISSSSTRLFVSDPAKFSSSSFSMTWLGIKLRWCLVGTGKCKTGCRRRNVIKEDLLISNLLVVVVVVCPKSVQLLVFGILSRMILVSSTLRAQVSKKGETLVSSCSGPRVSKGNSMMVSP